MLEGFKPDVIHTAMYDENHDIGTTYLGMSMMIRQDGLTAEHKTPIVEDCNMHGKLLDSTDWKIPHNMRVSKSFMSRTFFLNCLSLHSLPKFLSRTKNI